jgi:hypothetical protein
MMAGRMIFAVRLCLRLELERWQIVDHSPLITKPMAASEESVGYKTDRLTR